MLVLVEEESEPLLLTLLGSKEVSTPELPTPELPTSGLLGLPPVFKSSVVGKPKMGNTLSGRRLLKTLKGLVVPSDCPAATAGTMMAAANTATNERTAMIRP